MEGLKIMAKPQQTAPTPEHREILPISPRSVQLDYATHTRRYWVVTLDPSITLDDIGNRPELWRLCLQDKNKSPGPNDHIEMRAQDWTAFAIVNETAAGKAYLYDIRKASRPSRSTALFEDDRFKVEMRGAEYGVFRKGSNDPLPYGGKLFATAEQARRFVAEQYPVRVA
jgi:hypothetical protein